MRPSPQLLVQLAALCAFVIVAYACVCAARSSASQESFASRFYATFKGKGFIWLTVFMFATLALHTLATVAWMFMGMD